MIKRRLGKSDLYVSPIGMGCWAYGGGAYWGEQSQQEVNDVVHKALDMGVNLFDTAELYNSGESEKALGTALRGRRTDAVICSKISPSNAYSATTKQHCEASLKRLGTDYIDIYMLHWPINDTAIKHFTNSLNVIQNPPTVEEALDALMQLKKEGKIRHIGVSNFGVEQMEEALATGVDIVMNEMPYNIFSRAIEEKIVPFCMEHTISIVGSMALQQGLLAGLYQSAEEVPPHQAHSRHYHNDRGGGTSRHGECGAEFEIFEALTQLTALASKLGISISELSIAWVLAKKAVGCTLVGSRNVEQLCDNIAATEIKLNDDVIKMIDQISQPILDKLGNNPDYYERRENSRIK